MNNTHDMSEMTDERLQNIGRNFAVDMLSQAVETAKTPEQLNGQLHILNCAAIHILATNIFNRASLPDQNEVELIMESKEYLEDEIQTLKDHAHEMKTVGIDQNKKADQ